MLALGLLGVTAWQVVTQERIRAFADVTGDQQWIHVDERRATQEGPFGGTVAHGALTLALVPVFVQELLQVPGIHVMVNGGLESVRFRAPVPAGARVRGAVVVQDVTDLGDTTRVVARTTVQIEGVARPACVADQIVVLYTASPLHTASPQSH